jgi:hypothetical protein
VQGFCKLATNGVFSAELAFDYNLECRPFGTCPTDVSAAFRAGVFRANVTTPDVCNTFETEVKQTVDVSLNMYTNVYMNETAEQLLRGKPVWFKVVRVDTSSRGG